MSIKKTLRIILFFCSVFPVLFVSILTYNSIIEKLIDSRQNYLSEIAKSNGNGLETLIELQETEVTLISSQAAIRVLAEDYEYDSSKVPVYTDKIRQYTKQLLKERQQDTNSCISISLYNKDNAIVESSDESKIGSKIPDIKSFYQQNQGKNSTIYISDIQYNAASDYYYIDFAAPVYGYQTNKLSGYVVSSVRTSYFDSFIRNLNIGETGLGTILDQQGNIICSQIGEKIGNSMGKDIVGIIQSSSTDNDINLNSFITRIDGKKVFLAYKIIPELNWVLTIQQDFSELYSISHVVLIMLLFALVIAIFCIFFATNRLTKIYTDPIIKLRDTMRIASNGNLDIQCDIDSDNEFGELSKSLNKMLHIIKTNYDDLTSMHELLIANEEELRGNYEHIEYLAYHDVLTNLPNKLAFLEKVRNYLDSNPSQKTMHAIYFVDLDNFKTINDTLGHDYGDELLIQTASHLNFLLSSSDIHARAGGDEFLIFKVNISTQEEAIAFGNKILEAFQNPFNLHGEMVYVSMSIGIAIYPTNGVTINALIKNSDIAMYESKATGKNKVTLFDQTMEEALSRNTDIVEVLRHAIENDEIYLVYQPQKNIKTNEIVGYEALMRINSKKMGPLSPVEFIPIAEESGLIIELGNWALKEACQFNKELIDKGYKPRAIAVNISSIQINEMNFVATVANILKETNLPPEYLELEITESTLLASLVDASTLLNRLQALGVRISLDDFGTGYSSLNYLAKLPIHTLKIDKSFIDHICVEEKGIYMAEAIINLAHNLGIQVVAEGVETNEQLQILTSKNCDNIQGYLFCYPLKQANLLEKLDE